MRKPKHLPTKKDREFFCSLSFFLNKTASVDAEAVFVLSICLRFTANLVTRLDIFADGKFDMFRCAKARYDKDLEADKEFMQSLEDEDVLSR